MAQKRMFNRDIIFSDAMMKLTAAQKWLYICLNMDADDKGMIGNAQQIVTYCNARRADLKKLIDNGYIIDFGTGIYCVKHWNKHNSIRKDSDHGTLHTREYSLLTLTKENIYIKRSDCFSVTDGNSSVVEISTVENEVSSSVVDTGSVNAAPLQTTTTDQRVLDLFNLWNDNPATIKINQKELSANIIQLNLLIDAKGYVDVAGTIFSLHEKQYFLTKHRVQFKWFLDTDKYEKIVGGEYDAAANKAELDRSYRDKYIGWIGSGCALTFDDYAADCSRKEQEKQEEFRREKERQQEEKEREKLQLAAQQLEEQQRQEEEQQRRLSSPDFVEWQKTHPNGCYSTFCMERVAKNLKTKTVQNG